MALFNFGKNPNESAFVGGKKNWADVIKNSGPGELLIWRQPEEDFNTNSTLIVMLGEEAVFIKGGVIEQTFENGSYKLSTENYPFISRLRNAFTGGVSTFNCVVYFVRKAHSMELKWGTASPIQVRDPVMGIMTSVRGRGSYKIQIDNPAIFLTKLLGNNIPFEFQEGLQKYFTEEFQQHIKSSVARFIKNSQEEILGICSELETLANKIQPILQEPLADYGIKLEKFTISALDIPENDPNRQKLENAFSDKGVMRALGDDWGRQQAANILGTVAANPGAGGVAAAGAGAGIGMATGGVLGNMAQQMFSPMQQQQQPAPAPQPSGRFTQKPAVSAGAKCPSCNAENAQGAKFCTECGTKMAAEKVFCANCGIELPGTAKFCTECGTKRG
jgi:Putative virion core protein (lumpy skin disease virus)